MIVIPCLDIHEMYSSANTIYASIYPHCTSTCFLPFFFPLPPAPEASSSTAGGVSDAGEPPHEKPESALLRSRLTPRPPPYPKMVVWGLGAAGSEGKASCVAFGRGALGFEEDEACPEDEEEEAVWAAEPVIQLGFGAGLAFPAACFEGPAAEGSDGNDAAATGGRVAGAEFHPGTYRFAATGAGPASLVLFLSLRTRLLCFWLGWLWFGAAGLTVAARAQPEEADVSPCMPVRPGRLG